MMCAAAVPASVASAQSPEQEKGFEAVSPGQLATEQFPAAPLLISAYSVVLVGLFLYVVSVARRLNTVQREVERLEADVKRTGRA